MTDLDCDITDIIFSDEAQEDGESDIIVAKKISRPKMYKVLLHNDDYTTMEFVIHILKTVFLKNEVQAEATMLEVHEKGFGVCGVYSYEIAETKQNSVINQAKDEKHPLKCSVEEE